MAALDAHRVDRTDRDAEDADVVAVLQPRRVRELDVVLVGGVEEGELGGK